MRKNRYASSILVQSDAPDFLGKKDAKPVQLMPIEVELSRPVRQKRSTPREKRSLQDSTGYIPGKAAMLRAHQNQSSGETVFTDCIILI